MIDQNLNLKLKEIFGNEYTAQVYFVLKKDNKYEIKLVDIEDKDEPELREMFSKEIIETIIDNDELKISLLSTADENPNAIYRYDYDEYPEELNVFKSFNINSAINYDKFNFEEDSLSSLFGYIIYLGSMYNGVCLFKKHYSISLIKQDSFLLGMKKDKERFVKLPAEDIIRLNGKAELIKVDNTIYVMNIKTLEKNMGFTRLIKKEAMKSMELISDLNIVEDMQTLKDSMENTTFVRKLSNIKNTSPIFKNHIDGSTIIEFTKEKNALKGKFKYTADGTRIILDTKKAKKDFLALMNDGFLMSELTNQYYEVTSKDNL